MKQPRVHNEWFRQVSRGNRKTCTACRTRLEPGESIWSWGEYVHAKFRGIRDCCKNCWPAVLALLADHADGCGCVFSLRSCGGQLPDWMVLPEPTKKEVCCDAV